MKSTLTKEDTLDISILIALFRCFNEQLYNLKGAHAGIVKMKFNRLLKLSSQYEKEIAQEMNTEEMEAVYDQLMDIVVEIKQVVLKQTEYETEL